MISIGSNTQITEKFEVKLRGRLGPGVKKEEDQSIRILNRII